MTSQDDVLSQGLLASECADAGGCTDLVCMLNDQENAENKKVNMILYHYAQAVRETVTNPSLRCAIVSQMIADESGYGVSLHGLAVGNAALSEAINAALRQSVATSNFYPKGEETGIDGLIANPNWDANSYLRSKLTYGGEAYEPVVYFVKHPTVCETSRPISVIIGEEVNCYDEVVGWKNGLEKVFSEDEVKNSTDINIFVGTGMPSQQLQALKKVGPSILINPGDGASLRSDVDIDTDNHQIKAGYRYERSCKSEIVG